jgi:hypothetical protein
MSVISHIIDIWIRLNCSGLLVPSQFLIIRVQGFNPQGAARSGSDAALYICRYCLLSDIPELYVYFFICPSRRGDSLIKYRHIYHYPLQNRM